MKRIAIIGSGGAGKSTLAMALSECLNIPVFHLDKMYWQPGWVLSDHEDVRPHLDAVMARDTWIIDGNYSSSIEERIQRADTVIFLDLPVWLCLLGAVRRYFQYRGTNRPDMTEGNNE
ncbi:MAG: AAA family ATPase, partial [Pseudomonadota bacterium]